MMVEAELMIGQLRRQALDLQSLLHYLESRNAMADDDYSYSHAKLRELITHLKQLERFSSQRANTSSLRAVWLN